MPKYEVFASITESRRAKLVVEAPSLGAAVAHLKHRIENAPHEVIFTGPKTSIRDLGGHITLSEES